MAVANTFSVLKNMTKDTYPSTFNKAKKKNKGLPGMNPQAHMPKQAVPNTKGKK